MKTTHDLEQALRTAMLPENSGIEQPSPDLVIAARQMVGLRKREITTPPGVINQLLQVFRLDLRLYPVGISVLLFFGLLLLLNEPRYGNSHNSVMNPTEQILSLSNSSVSVNSSTLLTSTPTGLRN